MITCAPRCSGRLSKWRMGTAWKWPSGLGQRCAASGRSVDTTMKGGPSWSGSWRSKALNEAVLLAVSQGDHDWGEMLCQENLACCRELGDRSAIARTLYLRGWLALLK